MITSLYLYTCPATSKDNVYVSLFQKVKGFCEKFIKLEPCLNSSAYLHHAELSSKETLSARDVGLQ